MALKIYSINKEINVELLDSQIAISNSVINYSGLSAGNDFVEIYGDSILNELNLDLIINNHIAVPIPVYKLTNELEAPLTLDYDLFGLHKKRTFNQGELNLVEYYRNYDGETYSDLIVKEEKVYNRNMYGLVDTRVQTTSWYLTDDTVGCTKVTTKYFSNQDAMYEAETRRSNMLADAKLYTASQVGLANALDLMTSVNSEISLYVQGEQTALINSIQTSTKPYLTQEIKDTLAYILTLND